MNKNVPTANLNINENGRVVSVNKIYNAEYLPVGITTIDNLKKSQLPAKEADEWWINRAIPASRKGIQTILDEYKIASTSVLALKSLGLGLTD